MTLDGSASYDPDRRRADLPVDADRRPRVTLATPTAAKTTFTAVTGQTYVFKLTVTDSGRRCPLPPRPRVTAGSATRGDDRTLRRHPEQHHGGPEFHFDLGGAGRDQRFDQQRRGQRRDLRFDHGDPGNHHHLHLDGSRRDRQCDGHRNGDGWDRRRRRWQSADLRFEASPLSISAGQQSTLSWTTTGATQVSISGVGAVTPNGSTTVSPTQTTTYTLSATSSDGKTVTAPITITVATRHDSANRSVRGNPSPPSMPAALPSCAGR